MSIPADLRVGRALEPVAEPPPRTRWRWPLTAVGVALVAVGLFVAYRRMAWSWPINGDGASNALQAWDLWRGNPLLHGWTLSDVSFYGTELVQYAVIEMFVGVRPEVVHAAAALTYTLLVLVTAALAKGRATGWAGAVRIGVALAVMLVPTPGLAYQILLGSPDHTGSGVPMVLTWLILDRALTRDGDVRGIRWWVPVTVGVLLAWGQAGDPLVTFVGALPLVLVSALRLVGDGTPWSRRWRGVHAQLIAAGIGSIGLGHGVIKLVHVLGGFHTPTPPIELSPLAALPHRAEMTAKMIGVLFGVYRPGTALTPGVVGLGVVHALGLALVVVALVAVVIRAGRRRTDGTAFVNQILVLAILINIGAELVSTLSVDILAAREIAPVVPFAAALAGRVGADRLRRWRLTPVLGAGLAALLIALVAATPGRAAPAENQELADYLDGRGLTYGLASYWNTANVTVTTQRRVTVVAAEAGDRLGPFCWQTKADWYDATKHDARFVVYDPGRTMLGSMETITRTFGQPKETAMVGRQQVLIYDHNLLADLEPRC
jgi:hypothetical protein